MPEPSSLSFLNLAKPSRDATVEDELDLNCRRPRGPSASFFLLNPSENDRSRSLSLESFSLVSSGAALLGLTVRLKVWPKLVSVDVEVVLLALALRRPSGDVREMVGTATLTSSVLLLLSLSLSDSLNSTVVGAGVSCDGLRRRSESSDRVGEAMTDFFLRIRGIPRVLW